LPKFFEADDKPPNPLSITWDAKISSRSSSARGKILRPQSGAGIDFFQRKLFILY